MATNPLLKLLLVILSSYCISDYLCKGLGEMSGAGDKAISMRVENGEIHFDIDITLLHYSAGECIRA